MNTSIKPVSMDTLETAAKQIDSALSLDRQYPEMDTLLKNSRISGGALTGMTDTDYPSLCNHGLASVPLIGPVRHIPLPTELADQFSHVQCNCIMGLLPQISRGWVTIDTDIFFWNYETGGDLAYYEGLAEVVLTVGLITPRPGVFQPHIKFLLVVCTASEIVVLGVTFQSELDDPYALMHLQPNPLFTISSEGINMIQVKGTPEGRIFLAGANGHLFELQYQSYLSWFGKRCKLVNQSTSYFSFLVPSALRFGDNDPLVQIEYDESRQLLYTRSDTGSIYLYDLGADGQGISSVSSISQDAITNEAIRSANNPHEIDKSNFKPLVSISPIKKNESNTLALMGVTSSGVRIYFSISMSALGGRYGSLNLAHVRMPPGFAPNGPPQRPLHVHMASFSRGNSILCMSQNDNIDVVWSISPDTFGIDKSLRETSITTAIEGRVWALEQCPEPFSFESKVAGSRTLPPTIVCQHVQPSRRFTLLTSQGTFILTSMRPVDQLHHLLESSNGIDTDSIQNFFKLHREKEGCATALILICNNISTDKIISQHAIRAFFKYGGEPLLRGGMLQVSTPSTTQPRNANFFLPEQSGMQSLGGAIMPNEVIYSGKHDGICLYFARTLAPLWDSKIVEDNQSPDKALISRFTCEDLSWFSEQLTGLKLFLDEYAPMSVADVSDSPVRHSRTGTGVRAQAEAYERNSVLQLRLLVQYSIEGLELWRELCEHQFYMITERLPQIIKEDLCRTTFRDLVVSGKQITIALINALMERYYGDSNLTDALSKRLREICPNLYGAADLKMTKANELLQSAKHQTNKTEQLAMLQKSLELFKQVSSNIDLAHICTQFASVGFYVGVVELSLVSANQLDQQNVNLNLTLNGAGEMLGEQAEAVRKHCYTCITNTLNSLLLMSQGTSGLNNTSGVKVSSALEAEKQLSSMLEICYRSNDEIFHIFLYDWLIGNNLINRLLDVKSSYLEPYLRRSTKQSDNTAILEIMWKYYEKSRNYGNAARILAKLADRESSSFTLWDRIDYISRAILCAKAGTTEESGQFLHELEDKMDVAQLQLKIHSALEQIKTEEAAVALLELNTLHDISTLFANYAERFNLSECQLAILHCAGHYDPPLIQKLWKELLSQELNATIDLPEISKMSSLRNKIVTLGVNYLSSAEKFFPLQFIVQQLEVISVRGGWEEKWAMETLLQAGVSHAHLHEIYDTLLKLKSTCWEQLGHPFHLHTVIPILLTSYVAHLNKTVSLAERKPIISTIQDIIDTYVVDLQASTTLGPDVTTALTRFKSLQSSFSRQ